VCGFSVHWLIFLDEKLVIDADFLEVVISSESEILTCIDMTPSSPPKSLTQKAWVYNDGTGDIGDSPSQFLLVRGLDTMLQEETIAKGMAKLGSEPKRVLLIRDRKTQVSWGFAFVEYQDVSVTNS
jgi:RNA recognition motif-containing protein